MTSRRAAAPLSPGRTDEVPPPRATLARPAPGGGRFAGIPTSPRRAFLGRRRREGGPRNGPAHRRHGSTLLARHESSIVGAPGVSRSDKDRSSFFLGRSRARRRRKSPGRCPGGEQFSWTRVVEEALCPPCGARNTCRMVEAWRKPASRGQRGRRGPACATSAQERAVTSGMFHVERRTLPCPAKSVARSTWPRPPEVARRESSMDWAEFSCGRMGAGGRGGGGRRRR